MKRSYFLCAMAVLGSGCGKAPTPGPPPVPHLPDVVGPFTGTPRRFVVDHITLPQQRTDFSADLTGAGRVQNQLGNMVGGIVANQDGQDPQPLLDAGRVTPEVTIISDDPQLGDDPTVAVIFVPTAGDPGAAFAGRLVAGAFTSNRTRDTTHPVSGRIILPILLDADPVSIATLGMELILTPDGDGYHGELHGGLNVNSAVDEAYRGTVQMLFAQPHLHLYLMGFLDVSPKDGKVTRAEFISNAIFANLLTPDIQLLDSNGAWAPNPDPFPPRSTRDTISFGFGFHLSPCADGRCHAAPAPSCGDRILNGDETDIDCGGACHPCGAGFKCRKDAECDSLHCATGVCAEPTCSDKIRDGFEEGIDCGSTCPSCPAPKGPPPGIQCYPGGGDCSPPTQCVVTTPGQPGVCE